MRGRLLRNNLLQPDFGNTPRVCGEDSQKTMSTVHLTETPPRMRGRPGGYSDVDMRVGNTPAYAGKTYYNAKAEFYNKKHPRVCGEDPLLRF